MFKFLNKLMRKKGQSTLEYAVLIIIVIGALLAIQFYIKRGVQGRMKSATDDIGDQFSPGNTNMIKKTSTKSYTRDTFTNGASAQTLINDEVTNESVNMNIIDTNFEYWN